MKKLIFKKQDFIPFCPYCRGRLRETDDSQWERDDGPLGFLCPTHGAIPIKDVEMVDAREVD